MAPPTPSYRYHAFLSHRNEEPDRGFAWKLVALLEGAGFTVAIQGRDFPGGEAVVEGMARRVRESRYTLALLSPRYLESGYAIEEALISLRLGLAERRRRLIPLIFERVEPPDWLDGLVEIDFSEPLPRFDPYERLFAALREGVDGGLAVPLLAPKPARVVPAAARPADLPTFHVVESPAATPAPTPRTTALAPSTSAPAPPPRPARKRPRLPEASLVSLLESGVASVEAARRPGVVLQAIEDALPLGPENLKPLGLAVWSLDYYAGRSANAAERSAARGARESLLAPLRERQPPPHLPGPDDPDWAEIPAGSFEMGTPQADGGFDAERPVHRVPLSPFRLLVHPVTNREYRRFDPKKAGGNDLPVVGVDWYTAYAYAAWLGGRLPTEAEWEYAARAGARHPYADRYGLPTTLDLVGWYEGNSKGELQPVEKLEMNPWGLFDMLGNVWEWVGDWYSPYTAEDQTDPWGPPSGDWRVLRGGCFGNDAVRARAAYRNYGLPGVVYELRGFRVVLPVAPELGP